MHVKELVYFRGLTQSNLAKRLGLTAPYFSLICRGRRELSLERAELLAEIIKCPLEDLVRAFIQVRKDNDA